jgi:hypothetical protein
LINQGDLPDKRSAQDDNPALPTPTGKSEVRFIPLETLAGIDP